MKLISIDITNWKCFKQKHIDFDDSLNLLKWPNGTGKTSLIEAIIFVITDKRPSGLDFDSLRNDIGKNCQIKLQFVHNLSTYIVEREFGTSSSYKLYKDGNLISRTRAENKIELEKIIPDIVINGLWGYNSLALSPVLKTDYLFELLENEFAEPLALKKYFQTDRTYNQKNIATIEKTITNQNISEAELKALEAEIEQLEQKVKSKAFIADSQVSRARQAENDSIEYNNLLQRLSQFEPEYDRETCVRLHKYGLKSKEDWVNYFDKIQRELEKEKAKATKVHPLAKYSKATIDKLLAEGEHSGCCVLCGGKYKPVRINYDVVNLSRIEELENILQDKNYDFEKLTKSIKYFQLKKKLDDLSYINTFDWKEILKSYNEETNRLYDDLDNKRKQYKRLSLDFGKITDLLKYKQAYNDDKECIAIIEEYIAAAKEYYADSITSLATKTLNNINSRYLKIYIEDGVYKVTVNNEDFTTQKTLAVQSLSMGEKTIVSLSLILAVRDLFARDTPLIFDESFVNLDVSNMNAINNLIVNDKNQWIIVSHDERVMDNVK